MARRSSTTYPSRVGGRHEGVQRGEVLVHLPPPVALHGDVVLAVALGLHQAPPRRLGDGGPSPPPRPPGARGLIHQPPRGRRRHRRRRRRHGANPAAASRRAAGPGAAGAAMRRRHHGQLSVFLHHHAPLDYALELSGRGGDAVAAEDAARAARPAARDAGVIWLWREHHSFEQRHAFPVTAILLEQCESA